MSEDWATISNSESVFKTSLANSLISYCKFRQKHLSQKAAHITVCVFMLHSIGTEKLKKDVTKLEKEEFLEKCFAFLFSKTFISGITIRMLCYFYGRYLSRDSYIEHQKQVLTKNCSHLLQKLKKVWHNPTEDFKEMHNDLVKLILIREGMQSEVDKTSFDEMKAAVDAVFPLSSFSTFVSSNQRDKTAFINEVSSIATGIRLFAWCSHKSSKLMLDVGRIMKETLPKVTEDFLEEFQTVQNRIEIIQDDLLSKSPTEIRSNDKNITHEKLLLIFLTNYGHFIKTIKENVDEIAVETYKLDYAFTIIVKKIERATKTNVLSQAENVYPEYKNVTKIWKKLQLEGQLLSFYTNLFLELKAYRQNLEDTEPVEVSIPLIEAISGDLKNTPVVIQREDVKNLNDITLYGQDFCTYYLSVGVLVPCDRDVGIVVYGDVSYGFFSRQTLMMFLENPEQILYSLNKWLLRYPELVITLHKEKHHNLPDLQNETEVLTVRPIFIRDCGSQTVLHPLSSHMDYTYNWNQWDLRRQALTYVDLLEKKTHSTQTNLSHFRRENNTQVYLQRNNSTQTKKDAATLLSRHELLESEGKN